MTKHQSGYPSTSTCKTAPAKKNFEFVHEWRGKMHAQHGPVHRRKFDYQAQVYWLEYKAVCERLGFPVLWESPLATREREELKRTANGGRSRRRTKAEMELDRPKEDKE